MTLSSKCDLSSSLAKALGGRLSSYILLLVVSRISLFCMFCLFDFLCVDHYPGDDVFQFYRPTTGDTSIYSGTYSNIAFLSNSSSSSDPFVISILRPFTHWDASRFLDIALQGYTREQDIVFYPLFPAIISQFGKLLSCIFPSFEIRHALVLSGLFVSNSCSIISLVILVKLCRKYWKIDHKLEALVVLCFCCSPANVFNIAVYSESLFSSLTWAGIYFLYSKRKLVALSMFTLASCVRSNGVLNCVYFFYFLYLDTLEYFISRKSETLRSYSLYSWDTGFLRYLSKSIIFAILSVLLVSFPSMVWDYRARAIGPCACDYSLGDELVVGDHGNETRYWVENSFINISFFEEEARNVSSAYYTYATLCIKPPVATNNYFLYTIINAFGTTAYTVMQRKYWNVGAFRYYQLRQIPNFLLASPILYIAWISIKNSWRWTKRSSFIRLTSDDAKTSGISSLKLKLSSIAQYDTGGGNVLNSTSATNAANDKCIFYLPVNEFSLNTLVTCALLVIFSHIQISTRLLMSSSPVYIVTIAVLLDSSIGEGTSGRSDNFKADKVYIIDAINSKWTFRLLVSFLLLFNIVGPFMFANNFPWT